ncbi:type II toxin-antitoxin system Phd/YefM family antitoxin [Rhizobium sp. LjRoot30]|uniref:type II toxin-antitoxin system Phd/YefM family antitoxin n=1 Tax=Rhizobium sp. LjRoot30 TaxID=3342320 RepID=UPI003F4F6852
MQVTIQAAKKNLSKLIEAALAGEDVIIARGRTPVAQLVPIRKSEFKFGLLKDLVTGPVPDFITPIQSDRDMEEQQAFGLWADHPADGLAYQEKLRGE